jgi:tetratricopeptide (TPR) repeat protein
MTKRACFLLVLLSLAASVFAEDPDWALLEYGKSAFRERDYGKALNYFKSAREKKAVYPEADFWIGQVFMQEADWPMAQDQFRKAYGARKDLYVWEDQYRILYALAEADFRQKDYKDFEERLLLIVKDHDLFSFPQLSSHRMTMERQLNENGLDKLLTLYRSDKDFATQAHSWLGAYYVQRGLYSKAQIHLILAVVNSFSKMISYKEYFEPDWEYSSYAALFADPLLSEQFSDFAKASRLYADLYFLSLSLLGQGNKTQCLPIAIWLVKQPKAGSWSAKAAVLLQNPEIQPLFGTYILP